MNDVDEFGNLTTDTGKKIPVLKLDVSHLIDRTIAIYGPSGSGKTVIIKHILKVLNGHIEQILMIAPSEPSNRSYEGYIDPPLIHYRLYLADPTSSKKDDSSAGALRFLTAVWKRQEMMAAIYTRANNIDILSKLYTLLPNNTKSKGLHYINKINVNHSRVIEQINKQFIDNKSKCDAKLKTVNDKYTKILSMLYKKYISAHYEGLLARKNLSEDERYSLTYINFNPRLIIVFDDCAAEIKSLLNKDIFRLYFYQNRHSFTTTIMCCQDDTDLPANLRKNAFLSIFTEPIVCLSNFERSSNKFPKSTKRFIADSMSTIFKGFRKLVYIREDPEGHHIYHMMSPEPQLFRFGSDAIHELCNDVQSTGVTMDKDNPYYEHFAV